MKICVVTSTRAEYGLLKPLIDKLVSDAAVDLQLLVTGAHLSPEFGLTYTQIKSDGYDRIDTVEMLLSSDTACGIAKSMGLGMIGFADVFERTKPDLLVILGDRYEILSVASAAVVFKIPIAHLHGGEITEGAYDDAIRHAITKLSNLHFTSTEQYRERVIQLGEQPDRVFNVGAIGLDNIRNLTLLNRSELERELNVKFSHYNYLITFHPETLANYPVELQMEELLNALNSQEDTLLIFTKANADTGGRVINAIIDRYVENHQEKAVAFTSMGQLRYLSTMKYCTAVIGNSSSGIIEAPSFQKPVINIGDRQKGRIQGRYVYNVGTNSAEIKQALDTIKGLSRSEKSKNPYGDGYTSDRILTLIKGINLQELAIKSFYNLQNV